MAMKVLITTLLFLLFSPHPLLAEEKAKTAFSCEASENFQPESNESLVCESYDQWKKGEISNEAFFKNNSSQTIPFEPANHHLYKFIYEQIDFKSFEEKLMKDSSYYLFFIYAEPLSKFYDEKKAFAFELLEKLELAKFILTENFTNSNECKKTINSFYPEIIYSAVIPVKVKMLSICTWQSKDYVEQANEYKKSHDKWDQLIALKLYEIAYLKQRNLKENKALENKIYNEILKMTPFFDSSYFD
ncbi:MAG: hypothetical protein AAF988_07870, partial [Pseudomonadota bacterium]